LNVTRRGPSPEHAHVIDVVVDEQPGLFGAMGRKKAVGRLGAVLRVVSAGKEQVTKLNETMFDAVPIIALLCLLGIKPPNARVVFTNLPGIFTNER
jgi:hypothetical protein